MTRNTIYPLTAAAVLAGGIAWWLQSRIPVVSQPAAHAIHDARWVALFDANVSSQDRVALARKVDASLRLDDVGVWVAAFHGETSNLALQEHFLVFNEVLEQSRQRGLHPQTLGPFLISCINNASLRPTFRDYAVQHLSLWISVGPYGQPAETDPAVRRLSIETLCHIVGDTSVRSESIPGTALLALSDLYSSGKADLAAYWPELDEALSRCIMANDTPLPLRLAAVHAAATAGRKGQTPSIRRLADPASGQSALHLAAVAALGYLGDSSDRPLLESVAASASLARPAALAALKRLSP